MMPTLTFILDNGQELEVPLPEAITVGRTEGNDIVIDDARISQQHAVVSRVTANGGYQVRDLQSQSGTYVNDIRVTEAALQHGDRLRFGPLKSVFTSKDAPRRPRPAPAKASAAPAPVATITKPETPSPVSGKDDLQSDITKARAELWSQETKLKHVLAQHQQVSEELRMLEADRHTAADALQTKQAQLVTLQTNMANAENKLEALRSEIRSSTDECTQVQALLSNLLRKEADLAEITPRLEAAESQLSEATHQIIRLRQEHATKSADLDRQKNNLNEARAETEALLEQLTHQAEEITAAQHRLLETEQRIATARSEQAECELTLSSTQERARGVEDRLRTTTEKLHEAEETRQQIEARIAELRGTEEHLLACQAKAEETESHQKELLAAIALLEQQQTQEESALVRLHELSLVRHSEVADLDNHAMQLRTTWQEEQQTIAANRQAAEAVLRELQDHQSALQGELKGLRSTITDEQTLLADTLARKQHLEAQCTELAEVETRLAKTKAYLGEHESKLSVCMVTIGKTEARHSKLEQLINEYTSQEQSLHTRVQTLTTETDRLQTSLDDLTDKEKSSRERFEALSRLTREAELAYAERKERLDQDLHLREDELERLEKHLRPLRQWSQDMDQRYQRLATLSEDSAEARHLFHEIEAQKVALSQLFHEHLSATAVPLETDTVEPLPTEATAPTGEHSELDAPHSHGSAMSPVREEIHLSARLTRLRESIQRETARLQFLRDERAREEGGSVTCSEPDTRLRLPDRHHESKIRRDEERFAILQRQISHMEKEEEKRREKITELERKLNEVKMHIAEAERERSLARRKNDLAQAELRNHCEALERLHEQSDDRHMQGVLAGIIAASQHRSGKS